MAEQNYLNLELVLLSDKNYDKGNAVDSVLKYLDQSLRISPYFIPALELKSKILGK